MGSLRRVIGQRGHEGKRRRPVRPMGAHGRYFAASLTTADSPCAVAGGSTLRGRAVGEGQGG